MNKNAELHKQWIVLDCALVFMKLKNAFITYPMTNGKRQTKQKKKGREK